MYFAQHYLDCLSQASYLVGDETSGRAVVIDPRRDVEVYLEDAREHGLSIEGVLMTHFHADFLAGHLEMQEATGAWIGYGSAAEADFPVRHLADGERIPLSDEGGVTLQIMHTPGHTPESISVLVHEHAEDEDAYGVLTGDALFIGDVGRPDLLASVGITGDQLAGMLYDSVQGTLMGLADTVRVFPAHGAGSACGKNLSTETWSTIGQQRRENYACRPMEQSEFVAIVTEGQPAAPGYFGYDADLNRRRREVYTGAGPAALDFEEAMRLVGDGAVLLDVRDGTDFNVGHLEGALSIPVDGRFAETAGMFLDPDDDVIVLAPEGQEHEAVLRLARIGFDRVVGHLPTVEEDLVAHPDRVAKGSRLTAAALEEIVADPSRQVHLLDVRNPGEVEDGMIPDAVNIPMAQLRERVAEVPTDAPLVINCAGGWRSSVAASYLRSRGFTDVSDVLGGYNDWSARRSPASA